MECHLTGSIWLSGVLSKERWFTDSWKKTKVVKSRLWWLKQNWQDLSPNDLNKGVFDKWNYDLDKVKMKDYNVVMTVYMVFLTLWSWSEEDFMYFFRVNKDSHPFPLLPFISIGMAKAQVTTIALLIPYFLIN